MTSEYGAASQLEKIDMLDFADMIVLNKFDKRGAEDALRDVRKQWRRNHDRVRRRPTTTCRCIPTIASQFNDPGVNRLFAALCAALDAKTGAAAALDTSPIRRRVETHESARDPLIPAARARYLAEIAEHGPPSARRGARRARRAAQIARTACYEALRGARRRRSCRRRSSAIRPTRDASGDAAVDALRARVQRGARRRSAPKASALLRGWPARLDGVTDAAVLVHGARPRGHAATTTPSR